MDNKKTIQPDTPNTSSIFAESDYGDTQQSTTEDGFDVANAADIAFKVIATVGAGCVIYNQFTGSSEPAVVSEG